MPGLNPGTSSDALFPVQNQTFFERANTLQALPLAKTICLGQSTVLTAFGAGIDSLTWTGPNLSATTGTPTFTPTNVGTFTFIVAGTSACTSATASTTVTVVPPPAKPNLGPDQRVCGSLVLTLPVAPPGFQYFWTTGDTGRSVTFTNLPTFRDSVVIVSLSNGGCSLSDTVVLRGTVPPPTVSLAAVTTCDSAVTVTVTPPPGSAGNVWRLVSGGGTIVDSLAATLVVRRLPIGQTQVQYIARQALAPACTSVSMLTISRLAPVARVLPRGPIRICAGQTVSLVAGVAGNNYLWSTGATTHTITADTAGRYSVLVTGANGCTRRDTVTVQIIPIPPRPNVVGSDTVYFCQGDTATLLLADLPQVGLTYQWNTGQRGGILQVT